MENYLTIPKNFNSGSYYRFNKLNSILQMILKEKEKGEIIFVDIGSGDGQFMKYVKENSPAGTFYKFIGIDKYVKEKSFNFELRNEDMELSINLPDNYVDIIIAGEIIEHIKNTDFFIKETFRILKQDGDLIITSPNLASYMNRFLLLLGFQPYHAEVSDFESGFGLGILARLLGRPKYGNAAAGHLRTFTFRALRDFTGYYGFSLVKYYPVYFSSFRKDNKRRTLIQAFFLLDKAISRIFPRLASGMIFHLQKKIS